MIGNSGCFGSGKKQGPIDDIQETAGVVQSIQETVGVPQKGTSDCDIAIWRLCNLYGVMQERVRMLTWIVVSVMIMLVFRTRGK